MSNRRNLSALSSFWNRS